MGDTAAERAVLIDSIGPPSSQPSAVVRFGPDAALYMAIDDGGDERAGSDPGSFSGKVLRVNADATTPRDQMGASPVYAIDVSRPGGLDRDGSGRMWVGEPRDTSAFLRIDPGAPKAVRIARYRLAEGTFASGLVVYRSPLVPQFKDNLLIGSSDGRGLLRLRVEHDRGRSVLSHEWLLRGVVDGVRAVAGGGDGAIYLATADTLIKVDAKRPDR